MTMVHIFFIISIVNVYQFAYELYTCFKSLVILSDIEANYRSDRRGSFMFVVCTLLYSTLKKSIVFTVNI